MDKSGVIDLDSMMSDRVKQMVRASARTTALENLPVPSCTDSVGHVPQDGWR